MNKQVILLDTGILGRITHPKARENGPVIEWFRSLLEANREIRIPEICDYELRRKLLHKDFKEGLQLLDAYRQSLGLLPITTQVMLRAAELWAQSRKRGQLTAPPDALDGDVILAAQAESVLNEGYQPVVVSENVGHLDWLTNAKTWTGVN